MASAGQIVAGVNAEFAGRVELLLTREIRFA